MIQTLDELDLAVKRKFEFIQRAIAVGGAPSDAVAAQIVLYRTLGFGKDFALICMKELVRRRELGDDFEFEDYIDCEVRKIPKPEPIEQNNPIKNLMNVKNLINLSAIVPRKTT